MVSQLLVAAVRSLNPEEVAELQIIDLVLTDLIGRVKSEKPKLLAILTLDEIMSVSKAFGSHVVSLIIEAQLPAAFFDYVAKNMESFFDYSEPENQEAELIKLPSPFTATDQKPFRKSSISHFFHSTCFRVQFFSIITLKFCGCQKCCHLVVNS